MATETVDQHTFPRKRALAATRRQPRGAKHPSSPLRLANVEAVARLLLEGPCVLDAERFDLWQIDGLNRREVLAAIDDLARAGRVSIQVGRYGEREIGLNDPMREFQATGYDIREVPA